MWESRNLYAEYARTRYPFRFMKSSARDIIPCSHVVQHGKGYWRSLLASTNQCGIWHVLLSQTYRHNRYPIYWYNVFVYTAVIAVQSEGVLQGLSLGEAVVSGYKYSLPPTL